MTLTLDTSGIVTHVTLPQGGKAGYITWGHLNEFTRGYVEAAATDQRWNRGPLAFNHVSPAFGFSDLSPDTLAAMMADCETLAARVRAIDFPATGKFLWEIRQAGQLAPEFPPIALYLSEDGLIHHREAS